MSPLRTRHLHEIFSKLDKNGDGLVSLDELFWLLDKIGVYSDRDELKLLIGKESLDSVEFMFFYESLMIDGDKGVREIGAVEEEDGMLQRDLRLAFRVFDLNDDGFISSEELQIALSRLGLWDEHCGRDCRDMISVYDVNNDGLLDFGEFKDMMSA